jgi:cell division septation protein DedD
MSRSLALALAAIVLAAFPAAAVGPMQTRRERSSSPSSASAEYERVQKRFLSGDDAGAQRDADAFLRRGSAPEEQIETVRYLRALSRLKTGRASEARQELEMLEKGASSRERRAAAAVSVGDALLAEGEREAARRQYESAASRYAGQDDAKLARARLAEGGFASPAPAARPLRQRATEEAASFSVQVGSFSRERNAAALLDRLAPRYDAYLSRDGAGLYRVRVGRLKSRAEAAELERGLRREGYATKIVP